MEFLIDIIFVVFGDIMLQQEIQLEQTNYAPLLVVYNNLCSFLIYDLSVDL